MCLSSCVSLPFDTSGQQVYVLLATISSIITACRVLVALPAREELQRRAAKGSWDLPV